MSATSRPTALSNAAGELPSLTAAPIVGLAVSSTTELALATT